jgi:hypothetical protein
VPHDAEDFARTKLRGRYDTMMAYLIQLRRDLLDGKEPPAEAVLDHARAHVKSQPLGAYREAGERLLKDVDRLIAWRRPAKVV